MQTKDHADHIYHAASLADIHLQKIIDKGFADIRSEYTSDKYVDFNLCFTLSNCLVQLQTQLPAPAKRVFIQASHQLAIEINHSLGTEASETLKGILELLAQESSSMQKVARQGKVALSRKSAKPMAA
jgi:hypothetical protein